MEDIKIVNKIKSGPYWRVNLRPYEFNEEKIKTLSEIRKLLDQCQVSLRGWDFPHIDHQKTMNGQDWVQSECDFNDIIEFWRFFKSGQFIHYFSVYEHYIKSQKVNHDIMFARLHGDRFTNLYEEAIENDLKLLEKGGASKHWLPKKRTKKPIKTKSKRKICRCKK